MGFMGSLFKATAVGALAVVAAPVAAGAALAGTTGAVVGGVAGVKLASDVLDKGQKIAKNLGDEKKINK